MDITTTKIAAKEIHDYLRPYRKWLKKKGGENLLSLMKGVIEGKTVQLMEMGRTVSKCILPKTFCEKGGKALSNMIALNHAHLLKVAKKKFVYFIIDESDIQRMYARKIQGINNVRDGSTGNINGRGYALIAVIGVTEEGEYVPIILMRYDEIQPARKKCVNEIIKLFGPDHEAIWILDRGFDDKKFFTHLLKHGQQFIIRVDDNGSDRTLVVEGGEKHLVSELTAHMGEIGYRRVRLPGSKEAITLIRYHKKNPITLLTSLSPKNIKAAKRIAKLYKNRWKVEEYLRFIKQSFSLEDIMLKDIRRVDGLLMLLLIASAFIMERSFKIEKRRIGVAYRYWAKKENVDNVSWSSVTRFYGCVFAYWEINIRTAYQIRNWPLQAISDL